MAHQQALAVTLIVAIPAIKLLIAVLGDKTIN